MAELYPAQLDGYDLEIETLDDRFENAIVRHEIPMKHGALLENMGQKARTVNIRCYFWDHGDHYTYADHVDFISHLQRTELSELVHPQYGLIKGMIETFAVRHDDREMTAEVDITFVEDQRGTTADIEYEDVEATADEALVNSQAEQMESFAGEVRAALPDDAAGILETPLDPTKGILEQFPGYSRAARAYIKKVDTLVSTMEGTLVTVVNPANGIISTISYGTNLPGRVIGSIARCIERYVTLYDSIKSAPSRFLDGLGQAMLKLESTVGFGGQLRIAFASQGAHAVAGIYKSDETTRQQVRSIEQRASFDTLGKYKPAPETDPILTVNELETSLAKIRAMLQDGIDQDRSMESLKVMARSLLEHVNTVKLERDRIVTVDLDNSMSLHLVCLRYGLPYNMADRIASINRLRNPSFVSGEVQIYGR